MLQRAGGPIAGKGGSALECTSWSPARGTSRAGNATRCIRRNIIAGACCTV